MRAGLTPDRFAALSFESYYEIVHIHYHGIRFFTLEYRELFHGCMTFIA